MPENPAVLHDFTLIIPTFNRPVELRRLLDYLAGAGAGFPVSVLDSSAPAAAALNRAAVSRSPLQVRYRAIAEDVDPFDKFLLGAEEVDSRFAALCPDDDIPLMGGLQASLAQLRSQPGICVSHGWYFLFTGEGAQIDIHTLLYHAPSYIDDDPLQRLHRLVRRYQALTYGVYRTDVLRSVLSRARSMDSLLWREHLGSAAAVLLGKVGRVERFFMGRRAGGHAARRNWHPVEWMIADPGGMMAAYGAFAEALAQLAVEVDGTRRPLAEVRSLIHLIYADYLAQHMPQEIFDPIVERRLQGVPPGEVFRAREVVLPVLAASQRYQEDLAAGTAAPQDLTVRTAVRRYLFHPAFVRMLDRLAGPGGSEAFGELATSLDRWAPGPD